MTDQKIVKDRFSITYNIKHHEKGISKEEVSPTDGATDCIFVMSKLIEEDGKEDYAFVSLDGTTGSSVTPEEVFKAWVILAGMLRDNLKPGDIRRDLCADVLNIVYQAFDEKKEEEEEDSTRRILTSSSSKVN